MKRGLVFTLCCLAVASIASPALAADVKLSLNLRYTDPADPTEGGRWFLVGKTDSTFGLAGVSAYIQNIDPTGIVLGNNNVAGFGYAAVPQTGAGSTGSILNGSNPYNGSFVDAELNPDPINIVWGFDNSATGAVVANVGRGTGTPGNIALDPLKNPLWDNAGLLASGTFGAARPIFADDVGPNLNDTGANTLASATTGQAALAATTFSKVVRGDSLISFGLNTPPTAGLKGGDANRDFQVNFADFQALLTNYNTTGKTWDGGDFNDSANGAVDFADFQALLTNYNTSSPAPIVAIPEPSTMVLAALTAVCGLGAARRRRN